MDMDVPKIIIVACLVVLAGYGGWFYGKGQGWDEGRASLEGELQSARTVNQVNQAALDSLRADNETLRSQPVSQPVSQPRQSLTCNSYGYGMNSTSTTCY